MAIESNAAREQVVFELQQKLAKLEQERQELLSLIQGLKKHVGVTVENAPQKPAQDLPATNGRAKLDPSTMSRGLAAVLTLQIVKHPMTTKEIAEYLTAHGFDLSGKNALTSLYTSLMRTDELKKVGKQWMLKGSRATTGKKSNENGGKPKKPSLTLAQAAEMVLKKAGAALHANQIREGVIGLGLTPTKATIVSTMLKYQHKFKKLGGNMYALIENKTQESHLEKAA